MTKLDTRWMYTIPGVKEMLNRELDDKTISLLVSKRLFREVKRIRRTIEKLNIFSETDTEYILGDLETVLHETEYIKMLAGNEIKEDEWEEYGFDGDYQSLLNYTLETLYDLGDLKPIDNKGVRRKLIWVG